jgi:bacterial/archaeal transporter family protein
LSWILLALLSAFLLGFYDVTKKASVDGNALFGTLFLCSSGGALLVVPSLVITLIDPALAQRCHMLVPDLGMHGQILVLVKTGIVTLSWTLSFMALKHLPISIAGPVRATAPLFAIAGAITLFGEMPTPRQWGGIALILGSYWAFSVLGRKEGIHFSRNKWIWVLLAATVVGSASSLWDKNLLQRQNLDPWAMQVWFSLYNAILQGCLWAAFGRGERGTPFRFRWTMLAVGPLLLLADMAYFRGLSDPDALISVVSSVRRTNVVVSFVIGSLAFHDKNRRKKAVALVGVVAGLLLLI